eukprot:NODE_6042_length_579_cov_16.214602_g5877_i0.p2 GENE.NODE_6042_length_579_cov_16.214602_g5877_i0~~NODE_6042_length_579_cov_16.214602_g5877_i0.p2  ORF type:complete len:111 (+),score=11.48 NODE_6042_length_579_cov_16.214602_g5877_i0:110-442(+)
MQFEADWSAGSPHSFLPPSTHFLRLKAATVHHLGSAASPFSAVSVAVRQVGSIASCTSCCRLFSLSASWCAGWARPVFFCSALPSAMGTSGMAGECWMASSFCTLLRCAP